MERFHNLFAFVLSFGDFHGVIERENFELAPGRCFLFWWLSFVYGAANYIVVFGIFIWLSVWTNSAYFWYRKRRIYGLSDGQKYFVYSLNVYPKLYLEHFNVYFSVGALDRTRTRGTTNVGFEPFRAMSDSANIILFISLQNSHARYNCSFLLPKLTTKDETYGKSAD